MIIDFIHSADDIFEDYSIYTNTIDDCMYMEFDFQHRGWKLDCTAYGPSTNERYPHLKDNYSVQYYMMYGSRLVIIDVISETDQDREYLMRVDWTSWNKRTFNIIRPQNLQRGTTCAIEQHVIEKVS